MAFEMDTSRTADAAKLAVLWRDRDKPAVEGGISDALFLTLLEGSLAREPEPGEPLLAVPLTLGEPQRITGDASQKALSLFQATVGTDFAGFGPGGEILGPIEAMRAAVGDNDQVSSLWGIIRDLKYSLYGPPSGSSGPRATQRVNRLLVENSTSEDVPMVTSSVLDALKDIVRRLDLVETRLDAIT